MTNFATSWELQIGQSGDAVLNRVVPLEDGSLLALSEVPSWVMKVDADGTLDHKFGEQVTDDPSYHSGQVDIAAADLWVTSGEHVVVSTHVDLDPWSILELSALAKADGSPVTTFGTNGTVQLPYSSAPDGERTVAITHDLHEGKLGVIVARQWQMAPGANGSLPLRVGPSVLELLEIDSLSGAATSLGTFTLPPWSGSMYPAQDEARIWNVVAQPDGSYVALVSDTGRWSSLHLVAGADPTLQSVAVGGLFPAGMFAHEDGSFDFYISGILDGLSKSSDDEHVFRVTIDSLAMNSSVETLGPGIDLTSGPGYCNTSVAGPDSLLYAHTKPEGSPIQFARYSQSPVETAVSDLGNRCVRSLTLTDSGTVFAGTYDTSGSVWRILITKLVPAN
jgi:hypothetical protein